MSTLAEELVRPAEEWTFPTSTNLPFYADYRERRHLYLFSLKNLDLNCGEYGTFHVPASTWFELFFSQGTKITPYNQAVNVLVRMRAADDPLPYLPVEAFELSPLASSAVNAPVLPPIDVQYFELCSLQLTGPFTATVIFQGQNDQTLNHWQSADAIQLGNSAGGIISQTTGIGIFLIPTPFRFLQAQVSAYTSGTVNGIAEFYRRRIYMK